MAPCNCPFCGLPPELCTCGPFGPYHGPPDLPTPDGVPPSGWPGGGGYERPIPRRDVSFQCYTCECHFDCQKHDHSKRSLLLTTNWEDVAALWCENLITIGKYKKACEMKDMKVIKNETMHHYILTRLDNIEGCYSCLFLNGKMKEEQYKYFENLHQTFIEYLKGLKKYDWIDGEITDHGIWSCTRLFDHYLKKTLESDFFKENDIRIENRSF